MSETTKPIQEPFWLEALRMAAENDLMKDRQVTPIVNDGTIEAIYNYIVTLHNRLAAVEAERDALKNIVKAYGEVRL